MLISCSVLALKTKRLSLSVGGFRSLLETSANKLSGGGRGGKLDKGDNFGDELKVKD